MYIEAEKGLRDVVDRAAKEFAEQAYILPTLEEGTLIYNAMSRALQVILNYQREHLSTKGLPMTLREALNAAIREIRAYRGAALGRAVAGAIGAARALAAIGAISTEEAILWMKRARGVGNAKRARLASNN